MNKQNIFFQIISKIAIITLISFGILFLIFFAYYFWQLTYGDEENKNKLSSTFENNFSITNQNQHKDNLENWETLIKNYSPKLGSADAKIKIISFMDFNCEFCKQDYKQILNIQKKFPISQIIFKYSPILNDETNTAFNTALASACANEQNKFWQYYEKLFEANDFSLDTLYLIAYELELDLDSFESCFNTEKYKGQINTDLQDFNNFGIRGTPTYIVNGKIIEGIQGEEKWTNTIIELINN